jgi:hypothetical protein
MINEDIFLPLVAYLSYAPPAGKWNCAPVSALHNEPPEFSTLFFVAIIFSALENAQPKFPRYLSKPIFFLCL